MSDEGSRIISFAGSSVAIHYDGEIGRQIVEFLYRDVPADGATAPHVAFHIETGGNGRLTLRRDDKVLYEGPSRGRLANLLLGESIFHLADRSSGGGLLHAAALSWKGRGIVIPGRTGAGKTTATASLLTHGFDYLTDELVFVPAGDARIMTFTRPLNVKTHGKAALSQHFDFARHADQVLESPHATLVPLRLMRESNALSVPTLRLILFIQYRSGSELVADRLTKAQAGMRLMECLVNARNLPDHGFPEMSRLARSVPAYSLQYSRFEQLRETVIRLVESDD